VRLSLGNDLRRNLVPGGMRENPLGGNTGHTIQRYKPEQIVTMLRRIEVGIANEKTTLLPH